MPPRNPELPEGTDHIVNGAMEMNGDMPAPTGGDAGGAFIGRAEGSTGAGTGGASSARQQLQQGAANLKGQATDKLRSYAQDGKGRATSALDELSQAVNESADSIDEKLGQQYGQYARQAADAVSGFADTIRNKEVDELYRDAEQLVRKSPAVAIGLAAAVGFALVRFVKAGAGAGDSQTGQLGGTSSGAYDDDRLPTGASSRLGDEGGLGAATSPQIGSAGAGSMAGTGV